MDVGSVATVGSASESAGTWTVAGSGADIGGVADGFRFVSSALRGDGEITARVGSLDGADPWAKAGVMIRESTAANARFAMMAVTTASGACFQRRSSTGGQASQTTVDGNRAPRWIRLTRVGKLFSAYQSADGTSWQLVGTANVTMASDVSIGLAVTSHQDGALATAIFDNVTVIAGAVGNG